MLVVLLSLLASVVFSTLFKNLKQPHSNLALNVLLLNFLTGNSFTE